MVLRTSHSTVPGPRLQRTRQGLLGQIEWLIWSLFRLVASDVVVTVQLSSLAGQVATLRELSQFDDKPPFGGRKPGKLRCGVRRQAALANNLNWTRINDLGIIMLNLRELR